MQYEILQRGAFPLLKVKIDPNETIKAEMDAMVTMSPNIDLKGTVDGGLLRGIGRMLAGEKFFFQELTAVGSAGEVHLAPSNIGDIEAIELDGSYKLLVQKDGFLAGSHGLQVSTKMQNLARGFLSGEGFFIIEISGKGTAFISSYGAIHAIELEAGQEILIDNGHLVAWPDYMHYKIEKASKGWISTFTSGEGIVCRFRGPGPILIQSRNPKGFGNWIQQFLPKINK